MPDGSVDGQAFEGHVGGGEERGKGVSLECTAGIEERQENRAFLVLCKTNTLLLQETLELRHFCMMAVQSEPLIMAWPRLSAFPSGLSTILGGGEVSAPVKAVYLAAVEGPTQKTGLRAQASFVCSSRSEVSASAFAFSACVGV